MPVFKNILIVSDGLSEEAEAYKQAVSQARNNAAALKVLIICPEFPASLGAYQSRFEELLVERVRASVHEACSAIGVGDGDVPFSTEIEAGAAPATRVIRHVLRSGHDLVVKQAPPADGRKGFQAVDMELLRKCPCPVWLSRPIVRSRNEIQVAVAIDPEGPEPEGRALSLQLLKTARALADECNGRLMVLSAWDFPYEDLLRNSTRVKVTEAELAEMVSETESRRRNLLEALAKESGIAGDNKLAHVRGRADKAIPEFVEANNVDILVMGTVARTGIPGFIMGNTAENVLHQLGCSLLALKPNGYVSPVKAY
jgi:universal stress protein E